MFVKALIDATLQEIILDIVLWALLEDGLEVLIDLEHILETFGQLSHFSLIIESHKVS